MSTSNQNTTEPKDAETIKTEIFDLYSDVTKPNSPHKTGKPSKNVTEQIVALGGVAAKYNKSIFDVCEILHEKKIEQKRKSDRIIDCSIDAVSSQKTSAINLTHFTTVKPQQQIK